MKKNRVAVRRSVKRAGGLAGLSTTLWMSTAALAGGTTLLYASVQMPDSLVAKWLVRPLATISVATVDSSGGLPTTVGSTTTTTTAKAAPSTIKPIKLGINLMEPDFSGSARPFSNLVLHGYWMVQSGTGDPLSAYIDANGRVIRAGAGDNVQIPMGRPDGIYRGGTVDILCRWEGKATAAIAGSASVANVVNGANQARFTVIKADTPPIFKVFSVDPANPLTNLDCREAGSDLTTTFDPEYIALLKRFNTIRFMDWQETNKNKAVTWATRSHMVGKNFVRGPDGYPIELMIQLANETGTNPWFCIPWNADDDYVRKFAEMVRDKLDPKLIAHIEMSNEVWNWVFPVTNQAADEGLAEGLSTNKGYAALYRYAEKLSAGMDIWSQVFSGQMNRIVRVASFQAAQPDLAKVILGFRDTASKVDAIASAPYVGYNLDANPVTTADLSPVFTQLVSAIAMQKTNQAKVKATAATYGKRVLTYEGGQHITGQNIDLQKTIQHDPRMQDIYTSYMRWWQQDMGDLLMLYADTSFTTKYGAWGMLDNAGQAPGDTPKGKAVQLFQASITK